MKDYFRTIKMAVGYNGKPLMEQIEIGLSKGEILTLIGPNGSGKSTILKSIAGQLALLGGTIMLGSSHLEEMSLSRRAQTMAVLLTERLRTEMMTCEDVVATGRYPYTGRFGILSEKDREAVAEAMKLVHVEELKDQDFTRISDGQRQRVMLARAICQEPEIILLDEPTSFLDVRHKLDLLSILTRMARKKDITVIMSLHEIDLAEKVADRILTVKGNQQYGYGAPGEIFEENAIRKLYDIEDGYFDPLFGSIELKKPIGDVPEVFVLAGGGAGIPVYRQLQRENIPFATGVLYTNDLDYRLARLLAAQTITAEPFGPIPEDTYAQAEKVMRKCKKVILAGEAARISNAPLTALAEQLGLLTTGNEQGTAHT